MPNLRTSLAGTILMSLCMAPAASFANGQIFDLYGRTFAQPRQGLQIINGRKVIIRH